MLKHKRLRTGAEGAFLEDLASINVLKPNMRNEMLMLQLHANDDRDLIGIHRAKDLRMNALYIETEEIIRGLARDRK